MEKQKLPEYIRIDLVEQSIQLDESSNTAYPVLVPDPRRYRQTTKHGKKYWKDKYLKHTFGTEMFENIVSSETEFPLYYSSARIGNAEIYARNRTAALKRERKCGLYELPSEVPDIHRGLPSDKPEMEATFLYVDIVNSTKTRVRYSERYDTTLDVLFREMATTVGHFHGTILKQTGDGFICFLDHPSVNVQCDLAIDLGLALLRVLSAVNDAAPRDHPKLKVRIGAEHGCGIIKNYNVPATGYEQRDIIGDALNRAAKIQAASPPSSFIIGRSLYERIHVQWLERARQIHLDIDVGVKHYRTYIIE